MTTSLTRRQILPKCITPVHYNLFIHPDLARFTYSGKVSINLDVHERTSKVSINASHLKIHNVLVNGLKPVSEEYDKDASVVTWSLAKSLTVGRAKLSMAFDGVLNDQLAGFYRSVYKDGNGEKQVMATTQMAATDCRRAFPCFDEPALKATFDISIVAPPSYTCLSNMDVKSVSEYEGETALQLTEFNTTPKMSTYLVAFIVGKLAYAESNLHRVPVRVYTTKGLENDCQFSADLAAKTLGFFEQTFGIEYPLPKCDLVGIHDFSVGAMENWGLITFRLVALLYSQEKDSAATKVRVAEVVQHELAHQWFGNLVTMDWWDGLWLNEGFATWMAWYSCNHFFPEWKVWESYVGSSYQSCLRLDALRSSHPIEVPVQRTDEIAQIFDAISYLKGSGVIRMISQYLGEDVFIKGVSHYLKKHQYGSTTTDDLWLALSHVSGKNVKDQMEIWTKRVGFPLVTVEKVDETTVSVSQSRFLATGDTRPEEDKVVYPAYLGVKHLDGTVENIVLDKCSGQFAASDLFKLNVNQNGLFRVLYPTKHMKELTREGIKASKGFLSVEDRIGLISDLAALAGTHVKTSLVLSTISQWKDEPDADVWNSILEFLDVLQRTWKFENGQILAKLKQHKAMLVVPKAKALGYKFDNRMSLKEMTLKASLFQAAVGVDDSEFVEIALDMHSKGFAEINPNILLAVFRAVAKHGSHDDWNNLFNHYKDGSNGVSGNHALTALGHRDCAETRERILQSILSGDIRTQDVSFALSGILSQANGVLDTFEWLKNNWSQIVDKFPSESLGQLSKVVALTEALTTEKQLEEVESFFKDKDTRGIDQQLGITKDKIRRSILWIQNDSQDLENFLKQ